jgi:ribonuclease HII
MLVAGIDEVGWGPLAGPVVAVVYVMDDHTKGVFPAGVTDSKKLSPVARAGMYLPLLAAARDVGLGACSAKEIDELTPKVALQECYRRALAELKCRPDILYVDGTNEVDAWDWLQKVEPKADLKYKPVSAASIIAKHFRDQVMWEYHQKFPVYGWNRNSGYGTFDHEEAIKKYGLLFGPDDASYLHRRSYCKKFL